QLAGQQAAQRSAYNEAVGYLTTGLELLQSLPDELSRTRQELQLQLSLIESLRWTKGPGSDESKRAIVRAREICTQVGESAELFAVLMAVQNHQLIGLDLETACELGNRLLSLAESSGEQAKLMAAHGALGLAQLLKGEFTAARRHLEQAGPRLDWRQ